MSDRIRLRNPQKFNVGIITPDKPHGLNIAPGAFTIVSQDDLDYLMGTSQVLRKGVLKVEGEKQEDVFENLGIDKENNANFMSDEDIKKKLSGNANQLKKWLDNVEAEPYVLDRIADIASGMNLAMNKIKILSEKVPNYEFMK